METDHGARFTTDCLYPSAEPVYVYIAPLRTGYRVSDGGGAVRSALQHDRNVQGYLERASKKHAVEARAGELVAEPPNADWLYPAVLAVSNASALAARWALENYVSRSESSMRSELYDRITAVVPKHKVASGFEQRGRSGHMWQIDFAVRQESLILIKTVVQNGNSVNSNYAAFGDIGDEDNVFKFSVYSERLKQDSASLLLQVAQLVPMESAGSMTERYAYRNRLN